MAGLGRIRVNRERTARRHFQTLPGVMTIYRNQRKAAVRRIEVERWWVRDSTIDLTRHTTYADANAHPNAGDGVIRR
jgi:hypothetical protein